MTKFTDYALNKNAVEFKKEFERVVSDKVNDTLDALRVHVASTMFTAPDIAEAARKKNEPHFEYRTGTKSDIASSDKRKKVKVTSAELEARARARRGEKQVNEDTVDDVYKHQTHHGWDHDDSEIDNPIEKKHEKAMKSKPTHQFKDRHGNPHKIWHIGTGKSAETIHHFHDEEAGYDSPSVFKGHHSADKLKKIADM